MRDVACPICGQSETQEWARENGFSAVRCTSCRTVYVNPQPDENEISEANLLGVHQYGDTTLEVTFKRRAGKISTYESRLKQILGQRFDKAIRWLDVGAGYGETLAAVARLAPAGSQLDGVEPMAAKRDASDLVKYASLDEIKGTYDVVSLINVFSHLPDPVAFLKRITAFIEPGGELLMETGNGADVERADYPETLYLPDHLVFVGKEQITRVVDDLGMAVAGINEFRADTGLAAVKAVAKKLLGRPTRLVIPYTSDFRSLMVRARFTAAG